MQESGKTEEEIDKTLLWKKARELKTSGYESNVKMIVDKNDELQKSGSFGEVTCGTHNVLIEALGTGEQCGRIRWMGIFITPHQYFYLPKNVKYYLEIENERVDKQINKLEDDLEKLKRDENIQVMMEAILQGEALIPIPLEEEFIVKVKDALGHILSWPRQLVIRCSNMGKVVAKPVKKLATPVKKDATPLKEEI
ncbi:unnamed protein product [Lactuca saligna]|uniref:Uncharacterized protein n=1 Tax=Lactuca saligna TaxID=75948 RepID=A0AA35VKK0_LACSI|nr:unnamed protein product [Lactuca saligna]